MDREGDIEVIIVARMNSMKGGVEEEEGGQMFGQMPKAEKEVLFVRGNWKKDFLVSSGTAVVVTRCVDAVAKNSEKRSGAEFLDRR